MTLTTIIIGTASSRPQMPQTQLPKQQTDENGHLIQPSTTSLGRIRMWGRAQGECTPMIQVAIAARFGHCFPYYSSMASVATACFGSFVEPVLDSDISSRATWVRRLSAISSSARDLLNSAPTAGKPI